MAKHKKATEVTLIPREEKSAFQELVHNHWQKAAAVAAVFAVLILGSQYLRQQERAATSADWDRFGESIEFTSYFGFGGTIDAPSPRELGELSTELEGTSAGPWARLLEATESLKARDYDLAKSALEALEAEYPDHPLVRQERKFDPEAEATTAIQYLRTTLDRQAEWEGANPQWYTNPPLPEGAPRVTIETNKGTISLGLYSDRAPKHVDNFLKLVGEGFYDNTKFHRVQPGFMVQGGDPNSRDGEPDTWGQGGPGYKIDDEIDEELHHFPLVLSAAKQSGEKQSSGSQFFVTSGSPHHLNGVHTIFGKVLDDSEAESRATIEAIESVNLTESSNGEVSRPEEPIIIQTIRVVGG